MHLNVDMKKFARESTREKTGHSFQNFTPNLKLHSEPGEYPVIYPILGYQGPPSQATTASSVSGLVEVRFGTETIYGLINRFQLTMVFF